MVVDCRAVSEPCKVCGSRDTFERTLRVPQGPAGQRLQTDLRLDANAALDVRMCRYCQHARRVDDRDFATNIALQVDFFDQVVSMPSTKPRWPNRLSLVAHEVERLVGRRGHLLDIGCGTGGFLAAIGQGYEKRGIELSPASAEIARAFSGADIFCGPLEQYQPDIESFDVITAFGVIEHVYDPTVLVSWARDHLRHSGLLVISTGDRTCDDALDAGDGWPYYWVEEHVSFFSGASLAHVIRDAGFHICRREWRYSSFGRMPSRRKRLIAKSREIARLVTEPTYDAAYVYAFKY